MSIADERKVTTKERAEILKRKLEVSVQKHGSSAQP